MDKNANEIQHGGDHYKNSDFQHWDFVIATGQSYLIGCATKYVSRWRRKNGIEDLRKAQHYCQKASEVRPQKIPYKSEYLWKFLRSNDLTLDEGEILVHILDHNWEEAVRLIDLLINANSPGADQTSCAGD